MKTKDISGTDYFLDLCDYILGELDVYYNCEVQELTETGYSKESLKSLIQMVEDKNFKKRDNKDIENILTEIGYKISRQLSSVPVNITKFTRKIRREQDKSCTGLTHKYKVYFNKNLLFKEKDILAIETLYTILHELYHVKQFNNIQNFLLDLPYEEETLFTMFQGFLTATYPEGDFSEKKKHLDEFIASLPKRNKKDEINNETKLYYASLTEIEANLFATNMLYDFIEKGYFKNPTEALRNLAELSAFDMITFAKPTINFSKSVYNKNLNILSRIKDIDSSNDLVYDGEIALPKDGIDILKSFYEILKLYDMDKTTQHIKDKVEKVRTKLLLNDAFETYKFD